MSSSNEPLKEALRLSIEPIIEEEEILLTKRELLIAWFNDRGCVFMLQTVLILIALSSGVFLTFNALFGTVYATAGLEPTTTHTPLPPLPTRTSLPSATFTKTPWPTPAPQGKGRAMADIFTSGYEGFDNRFGSRLMGTDPDFEEYLLCFDGTGVHRVTDDGVWGTTKFCIPGIFYSFSKTSDILITSDIAHAIGLSEAEWKQINIHIYEHGAPDSYTIFCPAGVVAQTSKFCLGS